MTIRRFLIIAPAIITLVLLLSYFWVPTYEEQTKGNPDRLVQYITASTGDASMLNPILSADSASSQIEAKVFEGLIDRDENLEYRGRVAHSWKIYEYAYFYINENAATDRWGKIDATALVSKLRSALDPLTSQWQHVKAVELMQAQPLTHTFSVKEGDKTKPVTVRATAPPRVRLVLDRVDQMLFEQLATFLGAQYFESFDPTRYVTAEAGLPPEQLKIKALEIMPATAHNPVIEFYLRPGIKFHDGHDLTAEDVKFTYEAIVNPKNLSPRIPDYEPVRQVDVIDPLTVRIVYKRLYSPAFGTWGMGILPAHLLNDEALANEASQTGQNPDEFTMRQSRFNRQPIGCGPFVFQEWKSDQYIRMKRFEGYWEGAPNYREFVMRIIPDPLTQEMEFYAGTVDDYSVQPHQVARLGQDDRFQNFSGTAFGYSYIGYNIRREPFNDARVRRALGMAIDSQKIIDYVLYGQGENITGPFVKQTDFYNQGIPPLPYDPEGALKLLKEVGWQRGSDGYLQKNGKRLAFTLITNNGNPLRKAILAIAQDSWKKIGIQVETDLLEWSVFIQKRVNQLDFDALILGWSMGIDPDLFQIWHSSQSGPFQLNFVGFSNPEADDLIIKIRQEYDHDRQVAYCHRLHEIIAAEQPYTFLYVSRWTALLDKRIVRATTGTDGKKRYKPIVPTKTGGYTFHFNQWIKLNQPPVLSADG
ncbi:MAG: ABC transporter substrate-binding protein [Desulfobacteraceae bacterium]|jgi:ABC-type transport system substrate-binding protein